MNAVLFAKELKRNRKKSFIWTSIVLGFTLLILSIYPSFSGMKEEIVSLMSNLPESLTKAIGVDESTWSSITGFYSTYYGVYITLLMGIFTASTGATILGKEERDGTAEFLLTRPISRSNVARTKLAVLGSLLLTIYVIQSSVALVGIGFLGSNISWGTLAALHIHGFFLVAFFTGAGFMLGSYLGVKMNYTGPMVGMIFGSYFLNAISSASDAVEWLGYVSPYHYLPLTLKQGALEINYLACGVFCLLTAGMIWIGYSRYLKRDILG
jgi:ABC-2 type transport system permease protein